MMVHGLGIIHVIEVGHGLHREEHRLPEGVAGLDGHLLIETQGTELQSGIVVGHLSPLAGLQVIGVGIEHLGGDASHVLAVAVVDGGGLGNNTRRRTVGNGGRTAEHCAEKSTGMVGDGLLGVFLGIPCHIHEELDGIFHGLEVAHVQNPHALDAEVVGQRQLFEHLLSLGDVEPLGVTGCPDIVDMVVEPPTTFVSGEG